MNPTERHKVALQLLAAGDAEGIRKWNAETKALLDQDTAAFSAEIGLQTHMQRERAIIDLVKQGELKAAIQLSKFNEVILEDEKAKFNRQADELKLMMDIAGVKGSIPPLVIGSDEYVQVLLILSSYRRTLENLQLYQAVCFDFLQNIQLSTSAVN
jgi:hypothetical protein